MKNEFLHINYILQYCVPPNKTTNELRMILILLVRIKVLYFQRQHEDGECDFTPSVG